jgi:hypothetical protein
VKALRFAGQVAAAGGVIQGSSADWDQVGTAFVKFGLLHACESTGYMKGDNI